MLLMTTFRDRVSNGTSPSTCYTRQEEGFGCVTDVARVGNLTATCGIGRGDPLPNLLAQRDPSVR
jgi:hypothetical protein